MKVIIIILFFQIFNIFRKSNSCFEYSCEECTSNDYGNCIKCKESFTLIKGTGPCYDVNCALCRNGLPGSDKCLLCKNNVPSYNYYQNETYKESSCFCKNNWWNLWR